MSKEVHRNHQVASKAAIISGEFLKLGSEVDSFWTIKLGRAPSARSTMQQMRILGRK